MKKILILVVVGLFLSSAVYAFQVNSFKQRGEPNRVYEDVYNDSGSSVLKPYTVVVWDTTAVMSYDGTGNTALCAVRTCTGETDIAFVAGVVGADTIPANGWGRIQVGGYCEVVFDNCEACSAGWLIGTGLTRGTAGAFLFGTSGELGYVASASNVVNFYSKLPFAIALENKSATTTTTGLDTTRRVKVRLLIRD